MIIDFDGKKIFAVSSLISIKAMSMMTWTSSMVKEQLLVVVVSHSGMSTGYLEVAIDK